MQSHRRSRLNISEFEEATAHVGVSAEEPEELVLEFGEFALTGISRVVLHIVIQQMDGFGLKKLTQFGVLVNDISQMDFIDLWVDCLVSDAGPEQHPGQNGESLEADCQVPELVEEEGQRRQDEDLEGVLESFAAEVDCFECWEYSEEDVLEVGVERRTRGWGVFGLADAGGFEIVLEVGIVGRFEFVLPAHVVGVAGGPAHLVISDRLLQDLPRLAS